MKALIISAVAAGALAGCVVEPTKPRTGIAGETYRAINHNLVVSLGGNQMEVIGVGASGAPEYFCAAAEYARVRLNANPVDRIVLESPPGPSRSGHSGRAVGFELASREDVPETTSNITLSVNRVGEAISVAHGNNLCEERAIGFFD
ncbi:hypothetical protein [Qingshengfaniella alkalisoli]|uniref:Lipoprotein n=1 Tax=Qingshengfaniella alkalisoli TaxID=2599296 RepID=A0A5B8J3C2_9RHOB|nr:hypothetical protein [Qingshengfaniella alkalisoli]QDY68800.1 hypothetical protein FPZ52_03580 [Qingshengfaniella alkalisoli]